MTDQDLKELHDAVNLVSEKLEKLRAPQEGLVPFGDVITRAAAEVMLITLAHRLKVHAQKAEAQQAERQRIVDEQKARWSESYDHEGDEIEDADLYGYGNDRGAA
jgi:hypothetical protein